jgi:DNA-binding MarR family transcriptional regulator
MQDREAGVSERLLRVFNKFLENQKRPRRYGLEELLYPAEMHLITLIGSFPEAGVTELARKGGVTKGAVSQTAQKLAQKGLITKEEDPENGTRVIFRLTNKGKVAFYSHERMHEETDRKLFAFLRKLRSAEFKLLVRFLDLLEQGIEKRSET